MVDYCTVDDVKPVLQIKPEEDEHDTEIADCITSASALIDSLLTKEELTVPASVPRNVLDACKHFAAWDFRNRRDQESAAGLWDSATKFLNAYIETTKKPTFRS